MSLEIKRLFFGTALQAVPTFLLYSAQNIIFGVVNRDKIELLAPARDYRTAVTAIRYGADAVYIGAEGFGARKAAANSIDDIARLVAYAHRFGVRVYVTMNTIVYDNELQAAHQTATRLAELGVDALIVQDAAYLRMGLSGIELHASTQMNVTTPEEARFWGEAGCSRVVLERALSIDEIRAVCNGASVEVECFVHGAVCVGYSGRCFLSRSMCSRSGNRGECSQPCRMTYDLEDERGKVIIAGKHLLSVRDMNLSSHVAEMIDAGVSSFKIEGRLKDASYVQNVVAYYRGVIDRALACRPHKSRASMGDSVADFTPDPTKSFLRGESDLFYGGVRRGVASFDTPKSIGTPLGRVAAVGRGWIQLEECRGVVSSGDGICWLSSGVLCGTNVNTVDGRRIYPNNGEGIERGTLIYRNFDATFARALEASRTKRTLAVKAVVDISAEALTLSYTDPRGVSVSVEHRGALEAARNTERQQAMIREQVTKSGDTIFCVTDCEINGTVCFVPSGTLAAMRREALTQLDLKLSQLLPTRECRTENLAAKAPWSEVDGSMNVVNALAHKFYTDHGVKSVERGWDFDDDQSGRAVMTSRYCLRRELGECLKESPKYRGGLWLQHGASRYRLEFDCRRCEMKLIAEDICRD